MQILLTPPKQGVVISEINGNHIVMAKKAGYYPTKMVARDGNLTFENLNGMKAKHPVRETRPEAILAMMDYGYTVEVFYDMAEAEEWLQEPSPYK